MNNIEFIVDVIVYAAGDLLIAVPSSVRGVWPDSQDSRQRSYPGSPL